MACVIIWASSMALRAGDSQPLLLSTSTQAWIRRMACREESELRRERGREGEREGEREGSRKGRRGMTVGGKLIGS